MSKGEGVEGGKGGTFGRLAKPWQNEEGGVAGSKAEPDKLRGRLGLDEASVP